MKRNLYLLFWSLSAFTIEAFAPQSAAKKSPTQLALDLDVQIDPLVAAAGGLALFGGVGAAVISSKLQSMDKEEASSPLEFDNSSISDNTDNSIPYDAAARLAYEKNGGTGDYEAFKAKYEADAVADVISKKE